MPRININEVDNTLYSASNTRDNIVFVPGIATKGTFDRPILISNTRDFLDTFGDVSPNSGTTVGSSIMTSWDYAYNLINAGFSVLFRRVVCNVSYEPSDANHENPIVEYDGLFTDKTSKLDIYSKYDATGNKASNATKIGSVIANYPGTYGNRISFTIDNTSFRVYVDRKLVESYSFGRDMEGISDNDTIVSVLKSIDSMNHTFSNITVTIDDNISNLSSFPQTIDSNKNSIHQTLTGGTDNTSEDLRIALEEGSVYRELSDKYLYDIKFITSGGATGKEIKDSDSGHPVVDSLKIYENMLDLAYSRQDCFALFDIPFGQGEAFKSELNKVFDSLSDETALSYAAAYAPWCYKLLSANKQYKWCAPSFVFLHTLAESIKKGSFSWQIPAGVNRGLVTNTIDTEFPIGETLLNTWQNDNPASINPIMNLRNYGYTIFGQRTLYSISPADSGITSALKEVGVRLVTIDIKKEIFNIAVGLTFEANNIHTWSEFKGQLEPYLDNIKANRGISSYEILMDSNTTTIDNINNNTVVGIVRISPTRAAENFDISFEINQDTVSITDGNDSYDVVISE